MESYSPYGASPSRHESWDAWATLSLEHVVSPTIDHPEEFVADESLEPRSLDTLQTAE